MNLGTSESERRPLNLDRSVVSNVVLIGGTGSGKTTVAYQLSKIIGFGLYDLDSRIEAAEGESIASIFADKGEQGFREIEAQQIESISNLQNHVIVTGAGAVEMEKNRKTLGKLGPLIWLATPVNVIAERLIMKPDELSLRPLLAPAVEIEDVNARRSFLVSRLQGMLDSREPYYREADAIITSSFTTVADTASQIKTILLDIQG